MFETLIVEPILNFLFVIYTAIPGHDFGLAVILLTVLIRLALFPVVKKQLHSQKALSAIQPEVNALKEKYKGDSKKFQAATMELYKEKEVSPFSSCLPLIIQMPILYGIFALFRRVGEAGFISLSGDGSIINSLYSFVAEFSFVKDFIASNDVIHTVALNIVDLSKVGAPEGFMNFGSYYWPAAIIAILTGVFQFVQTRMMAPKKQPNKKGDAMANITSQMMYIFPVMIIFISMSLPAALALYWVTTTLFGIGQQYLIMNHDVEELEEGSERKRNKKSQRNSK